MNFRPAPNSLFAVLLRQRWWVSFLIAGVIVLLAFALAQREIAPFIAIGALPIAVIGCIAAWRQFQAPSPARVEAALDAAAGMPWRTLADKLEATWKAQGYAVERLGGPVVDFRLTRGGSVTLVSAKRWKAANHGVEPIIALHKAMAADRDAGAGLYLALQPLGDNARIEARSHNVTVVQGPALAALLL